MFPTLFSIGSFRVGTYGIMMAAGALLSINLASRECERAGFNKDQFFNFALTLLLSGIAGARLLYLLVEWQMFMDAPFSMIFAREGFVFYGGLIGAFPAGWYFAHKAKLHLAKVCDLLAPYLPLGHAFGRLGCFLNGCCYGRETTSAWGTPVEGITGRYLPVQLFESIFLFFLFATLFFLRRRVKTQGMLFVTYVFIYSIGRFFIELLRGDERGSVLGIFSTSQGICITLFLISGFFMIRLSYPRRSS